jgi:hypothetical protein
MYTKAYNRYIQWRKKWRKNFKHPNCGEITKMVTVQGGKNNTHSPNIKSYVEIEVLRAMTMNNYVLLHVLHSVVR